jgi:bacteriocin biosynthesis cyclodehydratase domain-containing protein
MHNRRPRLAYPFTVLTQPNIVRLIAGEDYRYTLTGAGLDRWLPDLLARCIGKDTLATLLRLLSDEQCRHAQAIIERLYGERVLVDGPAVSAHVEQKYHCQVVGTGMLAERLRGDSTTEEGRPRLTILCQDQLDYSAALTVSKDCRQRGEPFLWASYGALQRAYVSPLFLPDAGPCFACLLRSFQRLSPAPEIYDALLHHGDNGQSFASADFPAEGIDILTGLVRWKLAQAELAAAPAALYRLHVLERATFEVSTHHVFVDAECPECRGDRP